jgi:hypothetical protein
MRRVRFSSLRDALDMRRLPPLICLQASSAYKGQASPARDNWFYTRVMQLSPTRW